MTAIAVSAVEAKTMYRDMLRIRLVEERIADLYSEQEMRCPVHLCIGQEATAVGVCAALEPNDYAFGSHRSHGHYLAKGGDLGRFMAELYGKATGCCRGKGGSMHLIDVSVGFLGAVPIVGSTLPIAVGAAFGGTFTNAPRVTAVFFGEGATEEGVFQESLVFAALKNLPVVFVCENNLYSVYSSLAVRQPPDRDIPAVAVANGVAAARGDGNDVEAVYELARDAVATARGGGGPTLIQLDTYRWREHCGPFYDNDLGYRTPEEFEEWRTRCPVETFKARLLDRGDLQVDALTSLTAEIEAEIDKAVRFAKESPFPEPDELYADVYAG
ncbi:MAG TPA: thiamine pyrophosphate-dependent dehydrogenase E1 component subunit alpha [Gaiellaceae bacterium]